MEWATAVGTKKCNSCRITYGRQRMNGVVQRTYDKNGYRLRAGCLCYKDSKMDQLLLVSSSSAYWKVPGGGIDPGENAREAAVREMREEAGAIGNIDRCIGLFHNEKNKATCPKTSKTK